MNNASVPPQDPKPVSESNLRGCLELIYKAFVLMDITSRHFKWKETVMELEALILRFVQIGLAELAGDPTTELFGMVRALLQNFVARHEVAPGSETAALPEIYVTVEIGGKLGRPYLRLAHIANDVDPDLYAKAFFGVMANFVGSKVVGPLTDEKAKKLRATMGSAANARFEVRTPFWKFIEETGILDAILEVLKGSPAFGPEKLPKNVPLYFENRVKQSNLSAKVDPSCMEAMSRELGVTSVRVMNCNEIALVLFGDLIKAVTVTGFFRGTRLPRPFRRLPEPGISWKALLALVEEKPK